jgi:hypothetical protein
LAKPVQQKLGSRIFSGPPAPAPHAHNAVALDSGVMVNEFRLLERLFNGGSAENAGIGSQTLSKSRLPETWLKALKDV